MRKRIDYTGRIYGRLTVLRQDPNRKNSVICRCSCGNEISVIKANLVSGATRSCGCLRRETTGCARNKKNTEFATNFNVLSRKAPSRNNTTGVTGVSFNARRGMYIAYLDLHKRRKNLGYFPTVETAAAARRQAEEEYLVPLFKEAGVQLPSRLA